MASIKKGTRSRYWIAAFRDKNGRSQSKSTKIERLGGSAQERVDRKKKAQAIADDFERIAMGGHREEKHLREAAFDVATKAKGVEIKDISVTDFFEEYLDWKRSNVKPKSYTRYAGAVERFLESLEDTKLNGSVFDIDREDAYTFIEHRKGMGIRGKTIMNDIKNVRPAFNRAMETGRMRSNPFSKVSIPSASKPRLPYTLEEVRRLMLAPDSEDLRLSTRPLDWKLAIALGYFTGMRLGDCVNRKWSEFDLEAGVLAYLPGKVNNENSWDHEPVKIRIPLHADLLALLQGLWAVDRDPIHLTPSLRDTEQHQDRAWLSKQFNQIMDEAKVDPKIIHNPETGREYKQRSFHSLRVTCNSAMANAGISQEIRMQIVGHSSKAVNDDYTRFSDPSIQSAVTSIPGFGTTSKSEEAG